MERKIITLLISLFCVFSTMAQFMMPSTSNALNQGSDITVEQQFIDSIFPAYKLGQVPEGSVFLFKESMLQDGAQDFPRWLIEPLMRNKSVNSKDWFNGKEMTLTKISYKKPKGGSTKRIVWDMTCDGQTFDFVAGDSFDEVNSRYTVLGYGLGMVNKQDILDFKSVLSGKKVYTNRPALKWSYVDRRGTVPQYEPITLENCYVGRGNCPVRVTAITKDGERIFVNCYLRLFDESPEIYKMNSLAAFILLNNPRDNYPNIDDETWSLIQNRKIRIGMSQDELYLSWGEPSEIRTMSATGITPSKRLIYHDSVVILENGTISAIID